MCIRDRIYACSSGDGDATADQILSGKTAWVKGKKVIGTMPNRGAVNQTLNAGGSYTIPEGYHNGKGKITAASVSYTHLVALYDFLSFYLI